MRSWRCQTVLSSHVDFSSGSFLCNSLGPSTLLVSLHRRRKQTNKTTCRVSTKGVLFCFVLFRSSKTTSISNSIHSTTSLRFPPETIPTSAGVGKTNPHGLIFLTEIFVALTVDSHTVARNNTKSSPVPFTPSPPNGKKHPLKISCNTLTTRWTLVQPTD